MERDMQDSKELYGKKDAVIGELKEQIRGLEVQHQGDKSLIVREL